MFDKTPRILSSVISAMNKGIVTDRPPTHKPEEHNNHNNNNNNNNNNHILAS
jgi:hypothetical protein